MLGNGADLQSQTVQNQGWKNGMFSLHATSLLILAGRGVSILFYSV